MNDYRARVVEVLASAMGVKIQGSSRPRLYRNLGRDGFRDVSQEVGLDRAMAPMGANFGDIDNDGYLDIYLGTGDMSYEGLDVNLLFRNVDGFRFDDVTTSSGTGHLQKGHGVSFADFDSDGDLDIFVELGGATPGDRAYNALFRNPLHGREWLKLKLIGTKTNRAALGARIRVDLKSADGLSRSIYRTIGNNSSFGGNSLVELIGLLDERVSEAEVVSTWPVSKTTQTFPRRRRRPNDRDHRRFQLLQGLAPAGVAASAPLRHDRQPPLSYRPEANPPVAGLWQSTNFNVLNWGQPRCRWKQASASTVSKNTAPETRMKV